MKVWKHHVSEHFEENPKLLHNNGVGIGGTVFTDYDKMKEYLKQDPRRFHVVELEMEPYEIKMINDFMGVSLVRRISKTDFKPMNSLT